MRTIRLLSQFAVLNTLQYYEYNQYNIYLYIFAKKTLHQISIKSAGQLTYPCERAMCNKSMKVQCKW